jgi:hypothetical protein
MTIDALNVLVLDAASCGHVDAPEEIARALRLGLKLAVVDIVFDRELRGRCGERLVRRGLRVESLADVRPALALRKGHPCVSLGDAFSLSLAAANAWTLLTSSAVLGGLARDLGVSVTPLESLVANITAARAPARVSYPRGTYGLGSRSACRRLRSWRRGASRDRSPRPSASPRRQTLKRK